MAKQKPQFKPRKRASERASEDAAAKQARLDAAKGEDNVPEVDETHPESAEQMAEVSELLTSRTPPVITVTLENGDTREVKILRCKARQIGYVIRFLASAFKTMGIKDFKKAEKVAEQLKDPQVAFTVLAEVMDDAIATTALLTDMGADDFHELEVDDALAIMLAVFAVNRAFFSTRVLPMVRDLLARGGLDSNNSSSKTPESSENGISIASSG